MTQDSESPLKRDRKKSHANSTSGISRYNTEQVVALDKLLDFPYGRHLMDRKTEALHELQFDLERLIVEMCELRMQLSAQGIELRNRIITANKLVREMNAAPMPLKSPRRLKSNCNFSRGD